MCMFVHCYERNAGLALNLVRPNKDTGQLEIEQGKSTGTTGSAESSYVML